MARGSGTAVSFQDEFRFIFGACRRLRQLVHRNLEMPYLTAVSGADIYIQRLSSFAHTRDLVALARSEGDPLWLLDTDR